MKCYLTKMLIARVSPPPPKKIYCYCTSQIITVQGTILVCGIWTKKGNFSFTSHSLILCFLLILWFSSHMAWEIHCLDSYCGLWELKVMLLIRSLTTPVSQLVSRSEWEMGGVVHMHVKTFCDSHASCKIVGSRVQSWNCLMDVNEVLNGQGLMYHF